MGLGEILYRAPRNEVLSPALRARIMADLTDDIRQLEGLTGGGPRGED